MIEKEAGRSYSDYIRERLSPEEALFLKIPTEVGESLVTDISQTLTGVTSELGIVLPDFGLISGWNERLPDTEWGRALRETAANAVISERYPNGLVRLSPFYLKSEITYRMGGQAPSDALEFILAHEGFHLYQFKENYEQTIKDVQVFDREGFTGWAQTRTEVSANEYANDWLHKHFKPRRVS